MDGYRALAAAIIERAILDARGRFGALLPAEEARALQEDARRLLASEWCAELCDAIGIRVERLRAAV